MRIVLRDTYTQSRKSRGSAEYAVEDQTTAWCNEEYLDNVTFISSQLVYPNYIWVDH